MRTSIQFSFRNMLLEWFGEQDVGMGVMQKWAAIMGQGSTQPGGGGDAESDKFL